MPTIWPIQNRDDRRRNAGAGPRAAAGIPILAPILALGLVLAGQGAIAQQAGTAAAAPTFERPMPPPSLSFYGVPGLMDMPSAEMLPDGTFSAAVGYFGGIGHYTLTFQATPWLTGSFRYNSIRNLNLFGYTTYYDRNFDLRFRLHRETRYWPEITLGLQDFVGTGLNAAEYIVATKRFATPPIGRSPKGGELKLTAGLGWGRFGSYGSIGSPFGSNRPAFTGGTGGQIAWDQWFRGPAAPFAGVEWRPNDRWGLKLEYSSDAYTLETQTSSVFTRKSPFNFGVEYQAGKRTRLGAYYMYGTEFGVTLQFQFDPYEAATPMRVPAPYPVALRPSRAQAPAAWSTDWAASQSAPLLLRDALAPILREQGLVLETLDVQAESAELRFRNLQYMSVANAVGRAARAMAQVMPPSVETFHLVVVSGGMALSRVTIRRSDLEALEFDGLAAEALLAVTGFSDAPPLSETAVPAKDLYPDRSWSLAPYFAPSYFDPSQPFRLDVGLTLRGTLRPRPGWILSGAIRQRIWGNVAQGRPSNSVLPRVRTDQALYAQYGTTLHDLFAAYQWRPGRDLYARVTGGLLEPMFGGVAAELLWKPVTSPLALGVELAYVQQRDYDQWFSFRDYSVLTGFASVYYDFGGGYYGQVDLGRYLAGDIGATVSIDRVFDNGWQVGAFATKTNVSAAEFGEGSFDKGFRFTMPLNWFLGTPSRQAFGTTIRPIQRDGGAQVDIPGGGLYGQVRAAHRQALENQWARVWE